MEKIAVGFKHDHCVVLPVELARWMIHVNKKQEGTTLYSSVPCCVHATRLLYEMNIPCTPPLAKSASVVGNALCPATPVLSNFSPKAGVMRENTHFGHFDDTRVLTTVLTCHALRSPCRLASCSDVQTGSANMLYLNQQASKGASCVL